MTYALTPDIKAGGRIIFCDGVPYDGINTKTILNHLFFEFVTLKVAKLLH